jgi:hypothetical protein
LDEISDEKIRARSLLVLTAVFRDPAWFWKISIVVCIAVFDHRVGRTVRKLVFQVAAGVVARRFGFDRPFFRVAVVILHKLFF